MMVNRLKPNQVTFMQQCDLYITKTCFDCGEEKIIEDFSIDRSFKDGRNKRCRQCDSIAKKERQARYRQKNRERIKTYLRNRYEEKRDILISKRREWCVNNKDVSSNVNREYRERKISLVSDCYVKELLHKKGIQPSDQTIEMQREIILVHRLKNKIKEYAKAKSTNQQQGNSQ